MILLSEHVDPNDLGFIIGHWQHVVIMIVALFIYGLLLNRLLFKPVTRVLETREQAIKSAEAAVENVRADEARQVAGYEKAIAEARRGAAAEREKLKNDALKDADAKKEKVRAECKAQLQMAGAALRSETELAQSQLKANATTLANELLGKVLRRKVA